MRWVHALPVLALLTALDSGCTRAPSPAGAPAAPSGGGQAAAAPTAAELEAALKAAGAPLAPGESRSVTQVGSHTLVSTSDVPAFTTVQDEAATVSVGGRTVTIDFARERVQLDKQADLKLPAGAKNVEVRFTGGALSVTADGAALITAGAAK
jgi:hypothetical protein